ncbi:MAG: hypothetical protein KF779_10355 [Hyphomonadaceae bacterium]|nr:hypothetical protein [Hyphomonadaceae bacterium]
MAVSAMKAKTDYQHDHDEIDAETAGGWPPAVAEAIKITGRKFANGELNDQAAFDALLAAGISQQDAKALLRTFMLVSAQ